jgi:hypothetical protein
VSSAEWDCGDEREKRRGSKREQEKARERKKKQEGVLRTERADFAERLSSGSKR